MQNLDDRAIGGHRTPGGERDRDDGRNDHQCENANTGEHGRTAHRSHPLDPGAVVVDAGRGRHLGDPAAQRCQIERGSGLNPRDNDAR